MAQNLNSSVLASVIVVAADGFSGGKEELSRVARFLKSRYSFYEIVLVGSDRSDIAVGLVEDLARVAPQVRFLQIEDGADFDAMSLHGYSECIGDEILLVPLDELPYLNFVELFSALENNADLVRLRRRVVGLIERISSKLVSFLTGLPVDTRFCRTIGLKRQILSELLGQPHQLRIFRFVANKMIARQHVIVVDIPFTRTGLRLMFRRIDLAVQLLGTSAARILRIISSVCAAFAVGAFVVIAYVAMILLLKTEVAEGWSSSTILIAVLMFLQSSSSAAVCLGLSTLLDLYRPPQKHQLINEITASELFSNVNLLNVQHNH
ncbi:hypothetical protein [Rhizobium rhizogenes]|uniref:hypothetical protein n=1 Tax=Rhizobium rhizogenes TaxID=359 RepID=UPI0022C5A162|nr:hypothetical protein [Rhizobium rhizogenes]MCZ7489098.1 hypothetical protein [Rhizobium rhizogenes]